MAGDLMQVGRPAILAAAAVSDEDEPINLNGTRLKAVVIPAGWDSGTALAFYSKPNLAAGDPQQSDYALAFALIVVAGEYRVLTENEQAMAEGLWLTQIASVDDGDPTAEVAQGSTVTVLLIGEPR